MLDLFSEQFLRALAKINLLQAAVAGLVIIFSFTLRNLFARGLIRLTQHFSSKGNHETYLQGIRVLAKPFSLIFVVLGFYMASLVLILPRELDVFFSHLTRTIVLFTIFWILYRSVNLIAETLNKRLSEEIRSFFESVARFSILVIGTLSILQAWGINVGAFLAGLGLFGMAVALAAQDTMKNLFASLTILLDQTFKKGDWIKTGDVEGAVQHIGLRTTCLRMPDRSLVTIPNSSLVNTAVINLSRMINRRIEWTICVGYESTAEQLEAFIKRLRAYLEQNPDIETDPKKAATTLRCDAFTDSGIHIACTFFTKTIEINEFSCIKERCLLDFKRIMDEEGILISYAAPSIFLESTPSSLVRKNKNVTPTRK